MKKSVKLNYIYNMSYQILLIIAPLITTPYISRVLGANGIGVYSYSNSIVSYFVLFSCFGTATFGMREISYNQNDKRKRTKIFWETEIISVMTTCICLLVFIVFAFFQQSKYLYLILAINIVSVAFDVTWFFQGLEEYGMIVFRNFIFKILSILYIFIFVKDSGDLLTYILGIVLTTLLSNISLWISLPKYIERIRLAEIFSGSELKRNIKEIISLFIPTIAVQIYTVFDKTMIGLLTKDSYENGYYEQAEKLCKMALTIVTSAATVSAPRMGSLIAQNKEKEVTKRMYKSYNFVWFMGSAIAFGVCGISSNLVPWFFGSGFEKVIPLLSILCLLTFAIGINNVTSFQLLIPSKQQNVLTKTVCFGALINVVLNLLLIPILKSVGAAIASVLAESFIAVIQIYYVRESVSLKTIIRLSMNYIIAGFIMFGSLKMLDVILKPSVFHTASMIVIGAIIYFAVLIVFKDRFFKEIISMVITKIKNRFHLKEKGN